MRRPVGRAGSTPATGTGGSETVEYGCAWARVVADIGACSPVVGAAAGCVFLWRLVRGLCCASCVRFVSDVLFPLFWTVIPRGRWVRLLSGSLTLCGWGSIPLLSADVQFANVLCFL